jgi:TonB family protein
MKSWLSIFLLFSFAATAQELKRDEFDPSSNRKQLETYPVNLKLSSGTRMDVSLLADGSLFFLQLAGSGAGTGTVDSSNAAILTLDNDSLVTIKSVALQGIESKDFVNTYKHAYAISQQDLERLSRHTVRMVRKYSMNEYTDIEPDENHAANLKTLSAFFLQELDKAHLLKVRRSAASFPGGMDVWRSFINRNIKITSLLNDGEEKAATVQFVVDADGSVRDIQIRQSAGLLLDTELLRILKRMPKWKPAVEGDKLESTTVLQPVRFYQNGTSLRVYFKR